MGLQCHSKNEMIQTKMLKILFIFYSLSLLSTDSHLYLLFQLSGPSLAVEFWWRCMADLVGLRWWFDLVGFGGGLQARKHRRGTRGVAPASDAVVGTSDRVCVFLYIYFFSDSPRLGSIRADAAWFVPNRLWFAPNWADSAKIGPYRPYRVVSAGGRYGRNRPENSRNTPEMAEIGLEYGRKSRNLPSSFFFCESRHSICFLRIF